MSFETAGECASRGRRSWPVRPLPIVSKGVIFPNVPETYGFFGLSRPTAEFDGGQYLANDQLSLARLSAIAARVLITSDHLAAVARAER